jgi:hypothetical protein
MIGSANFTHSGISRRTEMCVQLDNRASVKEMKIWFKSLWENSNEIETKSLSSLIEQLPKTPSIQKPAITPSGSKRDVPLVELEEPPIIPSEPPPNIIYYQNARVHYLNGSSRLRVLKGSLASGNPSKAFFKYQGRTDRLRDYLIEQGILAREKDYGDYTFTTDYDFDAPGPAACIIDGNSRNGRHRDVFGNP